MIVRPVRRALLSVYDKSGLAELAAVLHGRGVEIISTGGTLRELTALGVPARDVGTVTGFPEILSGRVKTLHPVIHAGILAKRGDADHDATLAEHHIGPIDLVVVNLYPFELVSARPAVTHDEVVENIDVGGPTMIRAAAKNYDGVAVLCDPSQYAEFAAEFAATGGTTPALRGRLAAAAFARTAAYDAAVGAYFAGGHFPDRLTLSFTKKASLRYGENPHQPAAFYISADADGPSPANARQLHGKELSYNNLLDLDAAWNLVNDFGRAGAAVIKHNNPCGAAVADTLAGAFAAAYEGDPQSAFGGIVACNRVVDRETATGLTEPNRFIEAVIAPGYDPEAFEIITTRPTWKKNVRLMQAGRPGSGDSHFQLDYRRVTGGLLVQRADRGGDDWAGVKVVTKRSPSVEERSDLEFAWAVCKHVKSNAIVLAKNGAVVGVGAGQMSRVDAVRIAVEKGGGRSRGAVLASDAFFPFRDNVDAAAAAGVIAIVHPGGSVRDADSIAACDEHGLSMLFTGVRHFRH